MNIQLQIHTNRHIVISILQIMIARCDTDFSISNESIVSDKEIGTQTNKYED